MGSVRNLDLFKPAFSVSLLSFFLLSSIAIWAQDVAVSKMFTRLEDAMLNPNEVVKLDLRKQKLKVIPNEIFGLLELRELYLDKNQITELPADISRLNKLEKLSLQHNELSLFPRSVLELSSLEFLDLADNMIDSIPDEIVHLEQLNTLSMWDNPIAYYSPALSKLPRLKILDLLHNTMSKETQGRLYRDLPKCKLIVSPPCACMDGD